MPVCLRAFWSTCVIGCLTALPAWSWGPAGHHIVALIAQQRLSPETRARVAKLLLDGQFTMAQASTCPDALRYTEKNPLRPEDEYCLKIAGAIPNTGPWHYIDIPVPKPERSLEQYCPQGDCVTAKIRQFRDVLKNSNDDGQRREALMYLIHFVGDLHQPLHCAERSCDKGGNLEHVNVWLKTGERPNHTLHAAWDVDLIDKLMQDEKISDERAYADKLAGEIKPEHAERWRRASIDDIAWEGWELAKDHAYKDIPKNNYCDPAVQAQTTPTSNLTPGYEKEGARVAREQLMKAGVRLADLIEQSLTR